VTRQHNNLWTITQGQRLRYTMAIVAMAVATLFLFVAPLIAKYAIDVVTEQDLAAGLPLLPSAWTNGADGAVPSGAMAAYLWLSALLAALATAVGGLFQYLRGRWAAIASEGIVRRVREELFHRLHHLRASFYDTADTGDLVQRCSSDVETLRVFLSSDVVEVGRSLILLIIVTPILFWLNARLAVVALCLMPVLIVFAYLFFTKVKVVFQATDEAEAEMTAVLQENLTGIRVVRAFARQEYEIEKFGIKNAAYRDHNVRLIRLMGLYWSFSELVAMTQVGLVLLFGALAIIGGSITVGTLFAFLTYVYMVLWPVRQLGRVLTDSGKAVVSLGRINEVLSEPEESQEATPDMARAAGDLELDGVTFGYDPARPVITELSVHIRAGETVAIVGAPGAGKSTLIRLLLRLYNHQQGTIRLDGHDITALNRQWLRAQFGVVLQEPFLFSRSIAENLRVGRPDALPYELEHACQDAAIHGSIERLPQGYQAMVGERGVTLSGGQRQRLALARALLKDPPVLILDDSLSAVDTGTEQQILAALKRRKGRHTTLIIAHRLSSVMQADRIIVLEHGRCVQLGSHAELIRQPGLYQRLCDIQGALDREIQRDLDAQRRPASQARAAENTN
jgi:ATP-binding cassette, subfamily B, bacterial